MNIVADNAGSLLAPHCFSTKSRAKHSKAGLKLSSRCCGTLDSGTEEPGK